MKILHWYRSNDGLDDKGVLRDKVYLGWFSINRSSVAISLISKEWRKDGWYEIGRFDTVEQARLGCERRARETGWLVLGEKEMNLL